MPPKSLIAAVVGSAGLLFLTWRPRGGFVIFFAAAFLLVWLPYSGYVIWRYPPRRRLQIIKVCVWLVAFGGSCALHWRYYNMARLEANQIVQAVASYKRQHGVYPDRLEDVGVHLDEHGGPWHIGYVVSDTHTLIYPSTFRVFDAYLYRFEEGRWKYSGD
jgi:hypothetical protein